MPCLGLASLVFCQAGIDGAGAARPFTSVIFMVTLSNNLHRIKYISNRIRPSRDYNKLVFEYLIRRSELILMYLLLEKSASQRLLKYSRIQLWKHRYSVQWL